MSSMSDRNETSPASRAALTGKLRRLGLGANRENRGRRNGKSILVGMLLLAAATVLAFAGHSFFAERVVTVQSEIFGPQQPVAAANSLEVVGNVMASDVATVSTNEVGRVLEVLVEVGDIVEEGQPVAYLDDRQAETLLRLDQYDLELHMALRQTNEAELAFGRSEAARARELFEKDVISTADYEEQESRVSILKSGLSATEHRINMLHQQIALRRQILDDLTIRAPFGGIVTHVAAHAGEIISPISSGGTFTRTGICTIMDMSAPEFHFEINERFLPLISRESRLMVSLPSVAGLEIPAIVKQIAPSIDAQTGTLNVVAVPEAALEEFLRPGSRATGFFSTEDAATPAQEDILLPESAVHQAEGGNFVYIVANDKAARLPVRVEPADSGWLRVTEPWVGSHAVIVWSESALKEGISVRAE